MVTEYEMQKKVLISAKCAREAKTACHMTAMLFMFLMQSYCEVTCRRHASVGFLFLVAFGCPV